MYIRFRMTTDSANNVSGGGWWLDDVYVVANRTQVSNTANAITTSGAPATLTEGTNAYSSTTAFVIAGYQCYAYCNARSENGELQWNTENETGSPVYEIQRKTAGDASFVTIGTYTPTEAEVEKAVYVYR